jgi:hypothetical protein
VLLSGPTLRHALVIGVDGVRFDLLGPEATPVIWGFGRDGFLGPLLIDESTPPLTRQDQVAPLVLGALGGPPGPG